ncbi:hypothetical protein SteCoe_28374 [Stentor coeruleus]|uniref:Importin N-terminal domain-containing protein n=1 Tax=Stentor coeruleus TaxID=5963 RepID=A0A1R2B8P1_9CILI|nr:hypothetical protein SteCoe_28374 [Stentor coeruleus]
MVDFTSIFTKCFSAQFTVRVEGEKELKLLEDQSEFAGSLITYFSSPSTPPPLSQMAAVNFKNYIIKRWAPEEGPTIPPEGKILIKRNIYTVMVNAIPSVSSQLRESIEWIAKHDFPQNWTDLIQSLYQGLSIGYTNNPMAVINTLMTCHKLFKRYRYSFRSDELWSEIKLVVDSLFHVYFATATQVYSCLQNAQTEDEVIRHISTFIPLLKVFISLNGQDIPQQFDDTLKEWMTLLNYLLNYLSPLLQDDLKLFLLKSKVMKCLTLYAQKYDEDFEPYVKDFCTSVWDLLSRASGFSQYDRFVSACLEYFRVVTFKPQIAELIHGNLNIMFTNLILPNMIISLDEEDLADTAPMEFVKMFLEDANEDTRRCACGQLMKVLIKQFPDDINKLVLEQQNTVIQGFRSNPNNNWKQMDALILMLSGMFPTLYTPRNGASSVATSQAHILELYNNLVCPQLANHSFPILITSCLKFIYVYRNQFLKEMLLDIMGKVIGFLDSNNVLLASYAAATLERLLMIKNDRDLIFTKEFLSSCLNQLLQSIAMALQKHPKNTYIMNAFFRVIWISQDLFSSFAVPACDIFISYIKQVLSEPQSSEPHFNWLLFECIALAMKWSGPGISDIQKKLEPYMALIIQKSNADLLPYAFQIQAFFIRLLSSISQTNQNLISSILPIDNWESGSRYYLPTLVIFLENLLMTNASSMAPQISALCNIAHKLFTLGLDGQAFSLLTTLIETYSFENLHPYMHPIYMIIFTKLHNSKSQNIRLSPRFHRGSIMFVSSFILKYGWNVLSDSMNSVQPGIFFMLVKGQILQNLRSIETIVERRAVILAMSALMQNTEVTNELWINIVISVSKILDSTTNILSGTVYSNGLVDLPEENTIQMTRDSFQKVYSAEIPLTDKYPHLPNEKMFFINTICNQQYPTGSFWSFAGQHLDQQIPTILNRYAQLFNQQIR